MRSTKSGNGNVLGKIGIKHFSKKAMGLLFPSRGNHGSFLCQFKGRVKTWSLGQRTIEGVVEEKAAREWSLKALKARCSLASATSAATRKRSTPGGTSTWGDGGGSGFGGIHVGLFLGFYDVLLVPDSFVAKPIAHLEK